MRNDLRGMEAALVHRRAMESSAMKLCCLARRLLAFGTRRLDILDGVDRRTLNRPIDGVRDIFAGWAFQEFCILFQLSIRQRSVGEESLE